ncbi:MULTISPECIES: hypothetical protein [Nocardioides]|uniref:Flagellin C-terminal domain-containing protein n=1 Tax=Nocardioides vastitatis TaxID=2568655 RepID=A0ABW0ZCF4_9ACTN|nr:hypothetical protein [Nocardioides sp.]THI91590.1 hypothetical protein E7Z54_22245 [Nocardioides sp.]
MTGSVEEIGGPGLDGVRAARQVIELSPLSVARGQSADHAQSVVDQQLTELVYQASVAAMSPVIQPSLLDFLR